MLKCVSMNHNFITNSRKCKRIKNNIKIFFKINGNIATLENNNIWKSFSIRMFCIFLPHNDRNNQYASFVLHRRILVRKKVAKFSRTILISLKEG